MNAQINQVAHAADVAKSTHVLIIDDDLPTIDIMIAYLREYDFAVETVTSGLQGLERIQTRQPDLVLLDVSMPSFDGFDVLKELRSKALTRHIPILMVSSFGDTATKVKGFELGATDYITKPVDEAELLARITMHLQRHALQYSLEHKLRAYHEQFGDLDEAAETTRPGEVTQQEIERLYQARKILRANLASPPSLNDLASMIGTNQPSLSRSFRTLFGTTVFGFVRELRLLRARDLLMTTTLPVKTIALEVGYRNTSDLTRCVKSRFGLTPTQIRQGGV